MTETWYVLEDGSSGDPREISAGKDGKLVHADGRKVAYADHGPRSRSVEVPEKPFGGKGDHDGDGKAGGSVKTSDMQAEKPAPAKPRRPYKTRESKAD